MALKKLKQQINAFVLRHGHQYTGTKWTIKHVAWLHKLELAPMYRETLDEYMASYEEQEAKIERYDKRIEEIAAEARYQENAKKLSCFLGIRTHTALSLIVETGDFKRFAKGSTYAAFLGLAPGEHSSSTSVNRLGISKAGNTHLRCLLIEAAKGICKGAIGHKSKELRSRQNGQSAEIISYADKANTRPWEEEKRGGCSCGKGTCMLRLGYDDRKHCLKQFAAGTRSHPPTHCCAK